MALNPIPVGDAIASYVESVAPVAGTPVTEGQLKAMWEGIMTIIYDDLKANAGVDPGSFVAPGGGGAISGVGGPLV